MYPLVVACTTQSSRTPIIRSALSVADWWTTTGRMKHWPLARVKKIVCTRMELVHLFVLAVSDLLHTILMCIQFSSICRLDLFWSRHNSKLVMSKVGLLLDPVAASWAYQDSCAPPFLWCAIWPSRLYGVCAYTQPLLSRSLDKQQYLSWCMCYVTLQICGLIVASPKSCGTQPTQVWDILVLHVCSTVWILYYYLSNFFFLTNCLIF